MENIILGFTQAPNYGQGPVVRKKVVVVQPKTFVQNPDGTLSILAESKDWDKDKPNYH
jgi:hypothetical protein